MKQPSGKYVLMKDPEKPTLRLYSIPDEGEKPQEKQQQQQ